MGPLKITKITDFIFLSGMTLAGSWWVVSNAHIQAFFFFHGAGTLKITVGCLTRTYPAFTFSQRLLARSRSVVRGAHIQAFAQKTCTIVGLLGTRGKNWREPKISRVATKKLCKALRRDHLVSTLFLRPSQRKKVCRVRARTHGTTDT